MRIQQNNTSIRTTFPLCSLLFALFSLFTLLFSLSCKTAPKISGFIFEEAGVLPLEPGAFIYILADVQEIKPFLDVSDKYLRQMIDSSLYAAAAFYLPYDTHRYRLIAWGSYPSSRAKMALGANKDWKKLRSPTTGDEYWHSEKGRLSVALTPGQALISAAREFPPEIAADPYFTGPGTTVPDGFNEFRRGAIFSCWIESPGSLIGQKLAEMGIPLEIPAEQFFISVSPVSGQSKSAGERQYETVLRMRFPNAAQARALVTILSFARGLFSLRADTLVADQDGGFSGIFTVLASLLFTNPPVQDDQILTFSNTLNSENVSLLFKSFSLW